MSVARSGSYPCLLRYRELKVEVSVTAVTQSFLASFCLLYHETHSSNTVLSEMLRYPQLWSSFSYPLPLLLRFRMSFCGMNLLAFQLRSLAFRHLFQGFNLLWTEDTFGSAGRWSLRLKLDIMFFWDCLQPLSNCQKIDPSCVLSDHPFYLLH